MDGQCLPGHEHEPEPVTLLDGTVIGHVCRHCLVALRARPGTVNVREVWLPYTDDGRPLPLLPDPGMILRW